MRKPETVDDYIELIDQAIFEMGELIACAADEGEGESEFVFAMSALQEIGNGLKALHAEIMRNEHTVGGGKDLPFMPVVQRERTRIPVAPVIDTVNLAYMPTRKGSAASRAL